MKSNRFNQNGFSVLELLVSMSIFAVVSAGIVTYISDTLGRVGIETKAALVTQELKSAIGIMQSELRMAQSASPYNVGIDPSIVTCRTALQATPTTVRFIASYDDATATNGTRTYYIGYEYDVTTNTLYRGEVATGSVSSCSLPATDPLSVSARRVIATNVTRIDADNNGAIDNAFTMSGNQLQVRLGIEVDGASGLTVAHQVSTNIQVRVS